MKKIYKVPTSKNLYLIKNCLPFYKSLYLMNQKWSFARYVFVIVILNFKIFFNFKSEIYFSEIKTPFLEIESIYLLKKDNDEKIVIFTIEENKNYIYKFFKAENIGFNNELFIFTNIKVAESSLIKLPKIESEYKYKNWRIIKYSVRSFTTLNQNKNNKKFLYEYRKFYQTYLKKFNLIHNDFAPWNVAYYENIYEIFDWEYTLTGPLENDLLWFALTSKLDFKELNIDLNNLNQEILLKKINSLGSSKHDKKILKKYEKFKKLNFQNF